MKITALLVLKCAPENSDPVILANASDVSHIGYFQRSSVKEFVVNVGRTPPSQRQSVQHEEYKVHAYNRNGLCAVGFMDDHYPVRSAFSLLNQVLDEYQKNFGESWRSAKEDSTQDWPYLGDALKKFQDPAEADKLLEIQSELDETNIILVRAISSPCKKEETTIFDCLNSAEEGKESPTGDLSGNVSHETAETLSTNTNGPSGLLDSKTAVSELAESSAEGVAVETGAVATNSEAAQSVKEGTEPPVASPTILDGEISREVNSGSEVEVTKTTPVDVSEDIPLAEVSEVEESDIKERSMTNPDEEAKEGDSGEKNNETSGATASVASETETCEQGLEPKVVTSDTIHTGAKEDCADSQSAENKGVDDADADSTDNKVASTIETGEIEKHLASALPIEGSDTIHTGAKEDCVDSQPAENKGGDDADADSADNKVASTIETGETEKHLASASPIEGSDTIHTGAKEDCVDSQPAENKGGDDADGDNADNKVASTIETGETEKHLASASPIEGSDTIHTGAKEDCVDSQPAENKGGDDADADSTDNKVASAVEAGETEKHPASASPIEGSNTIHTGAKEDCADSQPAENKGGDDADADSTDNNVASTIEAGETEKHLASASPIEGSVPDASEEQTVVAEIEKRPFYFLPRVPRYDDEKLTEQLKHAEAQVDKKTQSRDALRADIQKIRATCKDYDITYKEAMAEEQSARKAMHSKRQEIDALQSVISRVKNAASIDDIDSRVHNMEHIIQHETISLSEEKGYIREIKQLKQLREQISSSMGTKDEIKQALDDKEKTEERLKVLRKELDALRNELSKVEAVTKAAKKKCQDEWEVQSKLQEQFRAADAVRQEAFVHLQNLKKQQREKNKFFFKYRDDSRAASEMALKKDRAALQNLCADQVENFMNKWNNDEEFRSYYVRCNTRSTVRRFGTLDGRSLGPDEEPPRIAYGTRTDRLKTSSDRGEKHETAPPVSAQQEKVTKYEGTKPENNVKAVAKPMEQKSESTKSKKTGKPEQAPAIIKELVSGKEEIEKSETKEEEEAPKLSKEEEELIKKEEEKRKQKEAAKIKEQRRLEEIAKAKEAMERKKKREEKAKARAFLKAQKEAEEREKEREKKLRKKERRKGGFTSEEAAAENTTETSETVIETPREIEIPQKQTAEESQQTKKSHKQSSQFLKHNKSKSIPLPLRNRASKRKLRQWMWIGLIVLVVIALFLLGNANLSFSPANLWFI